MDMVRAVIVLVNCVVSLEALVKFGQCWHMPTGVHNQCAIAVRRTHKWQRNRRVADLLTSRKHLLNGLNAVCCIVWLMLTILVVVARVGVVVHGLGPLLLLQTWFNLNPAHCPCSAVKWDSISPIYFPNSKLLSTPPDSPKSHWRGSYILHGIWSYNMNFSGRWLRQSQRHGFEAQWQLTRQLMSGPCPRVHASLYTSSV